MTLVKYENFCIFFPKKHAQAECGAGISAENRKNGAVRVLIPAENAKFTACAGTNKAQCALLHGKNAKYRRAGACKVKKTRRKRTRSTRKSRYAGAACCQKRHSNTQKEAGAWQAYPAQKGEEAVPVKEYSPIYQPIISIYCCAVFVNIFYENLSVIGNIFCGCCCLPHNRHKKGICGTKNTRHCPLTEKPPHTESSQAHTIYPKCVKTRGSKPAGA